MTEFVLEKPTATNSGDESAWTPIPDNEELLAKITSIQKVLKPYRDEQGNQIERVEFSFQVTEEGSFNGRRLRGETSTKFVDHTNCRLRNWVTEILGVDQLPAGFRLDTDDLVGNEVRVIVQQKQKPRKDGNGVWVDNSVRDILRKKKAGMPDLGIRIAQPSNSFVDTFGEEPF